MQCELCGNNCFECRPAIVDGVRMSLCSNCMRHGKGINESPHTNLKRSLLGRIKKPKQKDVYLEMDKDLVSNWNNIIKNARLTKKMTREELGFKIGERTVTISKIENGDLRPSDEIIVKLEKELEITLIEKIEKINKVPIRNKSNTGLTLGDFIKTEEK
jgi:putative transcription factor